MTPLVGNMLKGEHQDVEEPIEEEPILSAHFVERHLVLKEQTWQEAAKHLTNLFPRDTRPERPAEWYRLLAGTHWPKQVPPGNAPFYLPEWAFPENKWPSYREQLEEGGFEEAIAHVVLLPHNNEYLATTMRAADDRAWTANPITYRGYIYPSLKKMADNPLRDFNVEREKI